MNARWAIFASTLGLVLPINARQVEDWPLQRLFKEADVIVIGVAQTTKDTVDKLDVAGWNSADFIGQNTEFKIEQIVKGEIDADSIQVLHFRGADGKPFQNGPSFVEFRSTLKIETQSMNLLSPIEYLLFLRRCDDGRFEMISGQIDPEFAVREMHPPLPDFEHAN